MADKIRYFYLTHGIVGLRGLEYLCSHNYVPEYVFIHRDREYEQLKESYYKPINKFPELFSFSLIHVDDISEYKDQLAECQIGICSGFMQILRRDIFEIPPMGILNLHCGKLPEYRGRAPISRAIINGDEHLIMTLHKIDEGVDSGPILSEIALTIKDDDDVNSMYNMCCEYSGRFIFDNLRISEQFGLYKNSVHYNGLFVNQISDENEPNRKISDDERMINWTKSSREVYNLIRALLPPYPPAFFLYKGKKYYIIKVKTIENTTDKQWEPGSIVHYHKDGLEIMCGNGTIKILNISDEEGRKVNPEIFKDKLN